VRTIGDPAAIAPAVRKEISTVDGRQPVFGIRTVEQALSESIVPRRLNLFLLGSFAFAALFMALIGIYGVIAYSVTQRTHEIGVRMTLGAQRAAVVRIVLRDGLTIAFAGVTVGLVASFGLTRWMASMLFDVQPVDLPTFAIVTSALMLTASLAIGIPALRAALVDPMIALRYE
jgi:putative ABC transport system permease protein